MIGRTTIRVGNRAYSEDLDLDSQELDFYMRGRGNCDDWKQRTRPVRVVDMEGLRTLEGNHLLYIWAESLLQSDNSPVVTLTHGQPFATPWEYEFEVING